MSRLRGVPTAEVHGDVVTRLRGEDWFKSWAARHHPNSGLSGLRTVLDSTSLILLHGDPGTRKSALMHSLAPACALGRDVLFIQLNEQLRGQGIQGLAGSELVTIESIYRAAEQHALPAIVFVDEADAVTSSRGTDDIGSGAQENVATVDGLIVALDRASRRSKGCLAQTVTLTCGGDTSLRAPRPQKSTPPPSSGLGTGRSTRPHLGCLPRGRDEFRRSLEMSRPQAGNLGFRRGCCFATVIPASFASLTRRASPGTESTCSALRGTTVRIVGSTRSPNSITARAVLKRPLIHTMP
ncbi:AAA family ATPase [Umezawaea tangerina]|uniref:AAA family ATPase n=1 Tax=Umezawaea tangerina TaxID=84725 RepID=UPI003CCBF464